jgi:hypothetical protein
LLQIHELQYGPDVLLQTVITCFWETVAKQKNIGLWYSKQATEINI